MLCHAGAPADGLQHRTRGAGLPGPRRHTIARARPPHDLSAEVIETVAALALRSRLKEYKTVKCRVSCDAMSLLRGRVAGVEILGEAWRSPLDLTAQVLECKVGEALLDYLQMVLRQQIVLTNVPRGTARVVFSAGDFGNFLKHPLVAKAAAGAVQGHDFAFDPQSVRIESGSTASPSGHVEFSGIWRGDGQRYQVHLMPTMGTMGARAVFPPEAAESGVSVRAVPADVGARAGNAQVVGTALHRFFNALTIDLEGAELAFQTCSVTPAAGFSGVLELRLKLTVNRFPPLNVKF